MRMYMQYNMIKYTYTNIICRSVIARKCARSISVLFRVDSLWKMRKCHMECCRNFDWKYWNKEKDSLYLQQSATTWASIWCVFHVYFLFEFQTNARVSISEWFGCYPLILQRFLGPKCNHGPSASSWLTSKHNAKMHSCTKVLYLLYLLSYQSPVPFRSNELCIAQLNFSSEPHVSLRKKIINSAN